MNSFQIETWAISIIEQVLSGKPNEDSRVELKSEFPTSDYKKTARQLAGHANHARGESILWIIGVDQKQRVINGATHQEVATWYQKIQAEFDERIAPSLKDVNFSFEGTPLVALLFDTERFPFVVKHNEEINIVPWREGTRTRTATRFELLKLLTPLQMLPTLKPMNGEIILIKTKESTYKLGYEFSIYFEPKSNFGNPVVIPYHTCFASIECKGNYSVQLKNIKLVPPYTHGSYSVRSSNHVSISPENLSKTIENSPDELIIYGPGKVTLSGFVSVDDLPANFIDHQDIIFSLSVFPINAQQSVQLTIVLSKNNEFSTEANPGHLSQWLVK